MSEEVCTHEKTRHVTDVPIADPDTGEYLGRFDVVFCELCEGFVSQTLTEEPPPPPAEMPTHAE